jgi:hypothetical protein
VNDARIFDPGDWPHGLRCMDCDQPFVEGQPISERLVAMGKYADDPAVVVELVCVGCNLGKS